VKRYEYLVRQTMSFCADIERMLDELGSDGWRLVAVDNESKFYLMREIEDDATPDADRVA
jgi:hypothetical protein